MSGAPSFTRRFEPPSETGALDHHLAVSRVEVTGTLRTVSTLGDTRSSAENVTVALAHVADPTAAHTLQIGRGTQDLAIELTADGRLRSLTYERVGAGPAVVSAGARVIGFLGSVALRFARGAIASGEVTPDAEPPAWAGEDLLERTKAQADRAEARLEALRELVLQADTPARARELDALVRTVSTTLDATRADIARLGTIKAAWLDDQRQERTASLIAAVFLDDVSSREPGRPISEAPEPPTEGRALTLWEDFRLVLEIVDPRRDLPPASASGTDRDHQPDLDRTVLWRVPREAELWVWRAGSVEGKEDVLDLVSRTPVRIVDSLSEVAGLELRDGAFGEHGLALTFAEDGSTLSVTTSEKGAASAVANALGAVPGELGGAVAQAQEVIKGIDAIRDTDRVRAQAALDRELAMARSRNELLGLHATEGQAASLARLQQRVSLEAARRTLSPEAGELLALQDELAAATARNSVDAARRTGALETDLADVRAEVARLEAEVARARARWEIEHPDQVVD